MVLSTTPDTLWISEKEVAGAMGLDDAVAVLATGFAAEGTSQAAALEKTMLSFPGGGTLHALGASYEGLVGVKSWAHTRGGADPVLVLFDAADGRLVAVIEAFVLGQLRTAGTAALATDLLSRSDAGILAVIGSGKQALAQAAAVAAVRRLEQVRVYSRDPANRDSFATRVAGELCLNCRSCSSAEEAVQDADIVTLITRATSPVLTEQMVRAGVHINAVGAIDLVRREFEPSLLGRCALVVTDSVSQARNLSAELRDFFGAETERWLGLYSLADVVHEGLRRSGTDDITLFKGMGSGVEDLALGREILARVREGRQGTEIARGERVSPTLTSALSQKASDERS